VQKLDLKLRLGTRGGGRRGAPGGG
jgi:hypothetical protein